MSINRKQFLSLIGSVVLFASFQAQAVEPDSAWSDVLTEAKGQTVYFNAWGGSERINSYLAWAGKRLNADYGITLEHVKVGDIAEIVGQLEAAKLVGRNENGNVDLMWVNGENFAAMKRQELTWGSFATALPNAKFVQDSPSVKADFSVPVEGLESPWGGAQLVFIYDTVVVAEPPRSAAALLEFVRDGGRFTYPAPPAFHGTTFVKQLLIELNASSGQAASAMANPVEDADFEAVTASLWEYLDAL
ncbi:MAG: putative thiamine transport system substrate-binding protein, partial [Flavobacteriaceae bacterium]